MRALPLRDFSLQGRKKKTGTQYPVCKPLDLKLGLPAFHCVDGASCLMSTASRALPTLVLTSGVGDGGEGYSIDKKETKSQVAETRWPLVIPVLWRQYSGSLEQAGCID